MTSQPDASLCQHPHEKRVISPATQDAEDRYDHGTGPPPATYRIPAKIEETPQDDYSG